MYCGSDHQNSWVTISPRTCGRMVIYGPLGSAPVLSAAVELGEAGIVYFFAPWCYYCRTSIDNSTLVAGKPRSWYARTSTSSHSSLWRPYSF